MANEQKVGLVFNFFDVVKILFERGTPEKQYDYHIAIENAIRADDSSTDLEVFFYIKIGSEKPETPLNIQIEAVGHFELMGNLSEDIIDNYKNISAPSIVYPYIRAFLSNLTLQSGLNPINLPPINFASKQV